MTNTSFRAEELEGSIIDRFQRVVSSNPTHIALHYQGKVMSYGELDAKSNALACSLSATLGMKREPVALMFRHGLAHHLCQLAVLKTGKFYCNIDLDLTLDRQRVLLANLGASYVLHDHASAKKASHLATHLPELTFVNTESLKLDGHTAALPALTIKSTDYATIVYTSGSTGPPQGVLLTHQNILHIARSHGRDFQLSIEDHATQICGLWTGASISEIYCALLNGNTLYPYSVQMSGLAPLCTLLAAASITTIVAAPVLFRALMQAAANEQKFPSVRLVRLGGDRVTNIDVALLRRHFAESCRLRIGYGSTEFIPAAQFFIEPGYQVPASIPVGFAIEGCGIRIVDNVGNALDVGQVGEIEVTSKYLSPGYWNNKQLTDERYRKSASGSRRRYLTRDLGFRDETGCLYHVGRKDARVKIYGKMVLTTDVERILTSIAGIKEAVVVPFKFGADNQLAAFLVSDLLLSEVAVRAELLKVLPPEIVPCKFMVVLKLPLLSNNKVDRMQLQRMAETMQSDESLLRA